MEQKRRDLTDLRFHFLSRGLGGEVLGSRQVANIACSLVSAVMCEMLNLFVPKKKPLLGPPVRGLHFEPEGEFQRDFLVRFAKDNGVFLAGYGGQMCLCGFGDWDALYLIAKDLLTRNSITWVAAIHFWSKARYDLVEREVDPDDPEVRTPIEMGEMVVIRGLPAEQRRHRQLLRDLSRSVGQAVTLRLKNTHQIHGMLDSFDLESEVGSVDGQVVVAAQVLAVERAGKRDEGREMRDEGEEE